ncbi:MAG: DUF2235 domain-containing protein [Chloroflexi bacterium]|nr:DUF2235 domain-containing protein [Chloroflexota bacterium]
MSKRIIVCLDGTWNSHDQKWPTNVVKLARSVVPVAPDGVSQVVYYDNGVGTGNLLDRLTGGAFGGGLEQNIGDGYHFLMHNYAEGDAIFIFGYSRGAYTARSLSGLIRKCGILQKVHSEKYPEALALYRRSDVHPNAEEAQRFREAYSRVVEIWCLGVWDTVGALGVPVGVFRTLNKKKYEFHDVELSRYVRHGYHALAIDERRKPFTPTLWADMPKEGQVVEQVWFAGGHSNVGGGNADTSLSDLSLQWMLAKAAECGLGLDQEYLSQITRPNALGPMHTEVPSFYRLLGTYVRPIGRADHQEALHPSVMERLDSPALNYQPRNVLDFLHKDGQG